MSSDELGALRARADELGVSVKHQWGVHKLAEVIAQAENGEGGADAPPDLEPVDDVAAMMAEMRAEMAELKRKNEELEQTVSGTASPVDAHDHTKEEKSRLMAQARAMNVRVSDKWSSTQIQSAIAAVIEDVEDAAQARLAAFENTAQWVSCEVTEFGAGKVSVGRHTPGAGDLKAPAGKSLRLDKATAESLKSRGFVSIKGEWVDEQPK